MNIEIDQDITHTLEEYDVLRDDNLKKIEKGNGHIT